MSFLLLRFNWEYKGWFLCLRPIICMKGYDFFLFKERQVHWICFSMSINSVDKIRTRDCLDRKDRSQFDGALKVLKWIKSNELASAVKGGFCNVCNKSALRKQHQMNSCLSNFFHFFLNVTYVSRLVDKMLQHRLEIMYQTNFFTV